MLYTYIHVYLYIPALEFSYYISDVLYFIISDVGMLRVYNVQPQKSTPVWNATVNKGNVWNYAEINTGSTTNWQVRVL